MTTLIFKVEGMRNTGDARALQSLLSDQPGVETASVSFEDREIRVRFDSHVTNENRLFAAVQSAGYRVPEGCP